MKSIFLLEPKDVVCEHFDYSRQELYDIVKINKFKTHDEVLSVVGKGDGCEICKPVLSSIITAETPTRSRERTLIAK